MNNSGISLTISRIDNTAPGAQRIWYRFEWVDTDEYWGIGFAETVNVEFFDYQGALIRSATQKVVFFDEAFLLGNTRSVDGSFMTDIPSNCVFVRLTLGNTRVRDTALYLGARKGVRNALLKSSC